jgi:hypothetical protein
VTQPVVTQPTQRPNRAMDEGSLLEHAARRGALPGGDYLCGECGYGVTVRRELPRCPMCGAMAWEEVPVRTPRLTWVGNTLRVTSTS